MYVSQSLLLQVGHPCLKYSGLFKQTFYYSTIVSKTAKEVVTADINIVYFVRMWHFDIISVCITYFLTTATRYIAHKIYKEQCVSRVYTNVSRYLYLTRFNYILFIYI